MKKLSDFFRRLTFIMILFPAALFAQTVKKQPVDYVNNMIGVVDQISDCVVGPQLPFGSINPSPQTQNGGDDGYDAKEPLRGFGQLHVSGTGWGTNGQVFFSPQIGLAIGETAHDSPKAAESAKPYEYAVLLTRYNIGVKLAPSVHSAIYQFKFPKSDSSNLLLDITHNIPMDIKSQIGGLVADGEVHFDDASQQSFSGYGHYAGGFGGWLYKVYFTVKLSKKPANYGTWINGKVTNNSRSQALSNKNDRVGIFVNYKTNDDEILVMKVAVSYKSIEQAKSWLEAEVPDWNYAKVKATAKTKWNDALKKIVVSGGTEKDKTIFYTALYHAQLMPRNRTNDTEAFGKDVAMWDDHFAIWDTWRSMYPLQALINPEMVSGTVNSFIARFKKYGVVRDAFVNGNDMNREQGGNNIDNVIADAYVKGIKGVDWEEAYKVLKYDADQQRLGSYAWINADSLKSTYKRSGWILPGIMNVSMSLEYSYNDYCIASVAKGLGKSADYSYYLERSKQWKNFWNKNLKSDGFSGFLVPKNADGTFVDLDPKKYPGSWKNYYYEGSAWTYSWFVPHQFKELVALNGGKKLYAEKLNYGFKKELVDYSNEPAFLAVHSFIYADRPDLTSYWVRKLMSKSFTDQGYPGNDDSGAMSSWYIFSAMGFFPNAGQNIYYLSGPLFNKVTLHLSNGKLLNITAPKASAKNIYIKSVKINGKPYQSSIISHDLIKQGANIEFDMSDKPFPNE